MKSKREGDYTYRPLTGWFEHETSNVWNYTFSNGETIGATPNHPFFSERRQDYIPIGEIAIGEAIRNPQNEVITLTSKTPRTNGTEKVYNLEIYRDHNFLVGNGRLLVHNSCLPAGFISFEQFKQFGTTIQAKFAKNKFPNTQFYMQGSAASGFSFETGKLFDEDRISDFDIAVTGDAIYNKAKALGLISGNKSGKIEVGSKAAKLLGLNEVLEEMKVYAKRPVDIMIFSNVTEIKLKDSNSIFIPTSLTN